MKRCPKCSSTWDDDQITRCECGYRFTGTESDPDAQSTTASTEVVTRYRDAYRVGAALVGIGSAVKGVGFVVALVTGLAALASGGDAPAVVTLAAIVFAVLIGLSFWVWGVMVSAQGQVLRATLDNVVSHSPFLTDGERLEAMGLPQTVSRQVPSV